MRAVREAGRRVPADMSVVGFDDIPLARHFDPPLTTIRIPARALGAAAGRALVERLAGRAVTERMLLPTELIVRESTAPRLAAGKADSAAQPPAIAGSSTTGSAVADRRVAGRRDGGRRCRSGRR